MRRPDSYYNSLTINIWVLAKASRVGGHPLDTESLELDSFALDKTVGKLGSAKAYLWSW